MFALPGLVLMTVFLPTPAAQAGSWTYVVTGDNTGTTFMDNERPGYVPPYSPATSGSGSGVNVPGYTIPRPANGASGWGCDINIVVHAQIKFNWVPTAGQNSTTDPPPPNVLVLESANAGWSANVGVPLMGGTIASFSGSVADGLSDAEYNDPLSQSSASGSGVSDSPQNQDHSSLIGEHLTSYPASSGTVTLPQRTITAHANVSGISRWYYGASAGFGSYSATIHPQPYKMRLTPNPDGSPPVYVDNVGGRLLFHYSISSTDGNPADMTSITAYEALDWGSGNPGIYQGKLYAPPSPPVAPYSDGARYAYNNPQTDVFPALLQGYVLDEFTPPTNGFIAPYPAPSTVWSVTQNYLFDDKATGEVGTKIPGPDNNSPFTITRSVTPTNAAGTTGIYSVSAHGHSALKSLP